MDNSDTIITINEEPLERSTQSKIGDVIIILILGIIGSLIEFQLIKISPNEQYIPGLDDDPISNYNFAYPIMEGTISTLGLMMLIFLPWYILWMISTILLYINDKQFSWTEWRRHFYIMNRMILFSFTVCLIVIDSIKLFVGSPRPYFLTEYNESITNGHDTEIDARLSFPSGHSAYSFSQLFLLTIMMYQSWQYTQTMYYQQSYVIGMKTNNPHSYYLCGVWWLFRQSPIIGILLVFGPTYLGIWCGLTRIVDYKHFAWDVVAGEAIGAAIGYIAYLIYYNETYMRFYYELKVEISKMHQEKRKESKDHKTLGQKLSDDQPLREVVSNGSDVDC